ncbi:MAG: His-Xaa-Ser system radical SAM maturase HxsB [Selenomonadaceae bacterium]|nr:His-Xaa-Ser system radical SAM maturase HxsB [Selenomonadaceae bacterium]
MRRFRTRKAFLNEFTSLHMIVVTCRCNFKCSYCHASSMDLNSEDRDMTWEVAQKTVEMIFASPSLDIKIEFQGGEPLLNFEIIRDIVDYAEMLNRFAKKNLQFVICTNLTLIDNTMLEYCKAHEIFLSTSLDGSRDVQNANRKPRVGSSDGYTMFIDGLMRARQVLGARACSPLLTVTRTNLNDLNSVVDEYMRLEFNGVFIRALNPYGYASTNMKALGYSVDEFVSAYKSALNYIIRRNTEGHFFVEYFASLLLKRILTPFPTGFVDLQSPCGNIIGGVIYDYDGNVYASDEGRMLARMGDRKFLLGNVRRDSWQSIFKGSKAQEIVKASCLETLSECSMCAYQMYCGSDPVRYYTESGDFYGRRPSSGACRKTKGILDYIFYLLRRDDDEINSVFWSWLRAQC